MSKRQRGKDDGSNGFYIKLREGTVPLVTALKRPDNRSSSQTRTPPKLFALCVLPILTTPLFEFSPFNCPRYALLSAPPPRSFEAEKDIVITKNFQAALF